MSYSDTNVVAGQTNYYVATFESYDAATGKYVGWDANGDGFAKTNAGTRNN